MAIPYIQPTMALVRAVDGTFISYPFIEDGDNTTKVYNMVCTQQATDYSASQVALDTTMSSAAAAGVLVLPFPADSDAYFVGDTGHSPIGGGMISFTRTFANIPQTTTVASGSAFVTFPGISATSTPETGRSITSISMTPSIRGITINTTGSHLVLANDTVYLKLDYTVDGGSFIHSVSGKFQVLETYGSTAFRVDIGHYWNQQISLSKIGSAEFFQTPLTRPPSTFNVSTQTRYDYILPGVTPSVFDVLDISVPPAFEVVNQSTGVVADTAFNTYTNPELETIIGTKPNATQYVSMRDDNVNIVIESSLAEWAGNILVMKTKTCKAR